MKPDGGTRPCLGRRSRPRAVGRPGWRNGPGGRSGSALLGTIIVATLAAGCAREGAPPGGPTDRLPPIVVSSEPDTFSTVEPFRTPVTFRFSERISERPGAGTLDQAVVVSPVSGDVQVSHGRAGLTVRVLGGFEAGRVYRLTVRPVIEDMFGNSLQEPYELFFSTGPEFTSNVVAGSVVDRLSGEFLPDARVDAVVAGSDIVHTSLTDTAGIFALRYLPAGEYQVTAYLDLNRNGEADFNEPQGTRPAPLRGTAEATDTAIVLDVALLPKDTTAARLTRVVVEDSISLRVSTDDYLDPELPLDDVRVRISSDSVDGPQAMAVLYEHEVEVFRSALADSLARARAMADSIAQEQTAGGSVESPEGDSTAVSDSAAAPPEAEQGRPADAGGGGDEPGEEEPERPRPQQTLFVILDGELVPGVLYEAELEGITNINGVAEGGGTITFTRPIPPPPQDTTGTATDSVPRDTTGVVTDSMPADTIPAAPEDTMRQDTVPPTDTLAAPGDTIRRDTIPPPPGDSVRRDTIPASADTARRDTIPSMPAARGLFFQRFPRPTSP